MDNKNKPQRQPLCTLWEGSWLGCLLGRTKQWSAHLERSAEGLSLRLISGTYSRSLPLIDIQGIRIKPGWLWSRLHIATTGAESVHVGVWRWKAQRPADNLHRQITREVERQIAIALRPLDQLEAQTKAFLASDRYIRHSDVTRFKASTRDVADPAIRRIFELLSHPFAKNMDGRHKTWLRVTHVANAREPSSPIIKERNEAFVTKELETYGGFFDRVEKTPLTVEQRHAAVIFEDRNLLVAAAGSGKSSTLVGKAGYAVHRGLFKPNEMVALAFNRKAAQELNERVNLRIKPWLEGKAVKAHTFHGLGYAVLRKLAREQGRKIRLAKENSEKPRLQAVLHELLRSSPEFAQDWMLFLSICREPIPPDNAFDSLDDYNNYVANQRQARRDGKPAAFQALTGDVVKSAQELAIANWLYIQGVPFDYERPFTPVPEGWDKYQPDFYLPDVGAWYEHFALDATGKAPAHFRDYATQAQIKRDWMAQHATDHFFETRSHQYYDGTLFNHLKACLLKVGQPLRPRSAAEVLETIRALGQSDSLDLVIKILHLVKGNAVSQVEFADRLKLLHDPVRATLFTKVFWPIYGAYNERLGREGCVDYNDMIIQAAKALENGAQSSPYKLVLVDEFQDLSIGRARLIRAMLAQHDDSVLFGVGDDWQAINGFAGSDLRLFMDFEAKFGPTHEGVLTKTFRCAQGIADVSSSFIQQNKAGQKAKTVISELDSTITGVVDLLDVGNDNEVAGELDQQLFTLAGSQRTAAAAAPGTKKYSVFLLSRYGLDKTNGIDQRWLTLMIRKYGDALDIEFTTMHKSKGLEADYVFLLGLNAGMGLTFPSTMVNDPLIDVLLQNNDLFPYAEERRLFYVALTRAKRRCFILFRQMNPSAFVLELMTQRYKGMVTYRAAELPQRCTSCGRGFMVKRRGPWGAFLGCTRFAAEQCNNTIKLS